MQRVLITEAIAQPGVDKLKTHFKVDVSTGLAAEELLERIADYDALIVRSATKVTRDVIEAGSKLKIVGRAGVGVDNVDVQAATERGIIVCNAPTSNIMSAAEHTIALMMAQARSIPQANVSMKAGKWERGKFTGTEVYEKTLGILGVGRIGGLVAERAKGLGMRVLGYDPYVTEERTRALGVECVDFDELLKESDFISVHLPKTKETIGMFGPKEFAKMKDGVRLLNTARGGIYQEEALVEALKSGKVASAGIDVYPVEPCTEAPYFAFDQVIVTPHLGASTEEAQDRAGEQIAEYVASGLLGDFVPTAVNIVPVSREVMEQVGPYMQLAEQMGRMLAQTVRGTIGEVEVSFIGGLADVDTRILKTAVLKGMLDVVTPGNVNLVNANLYAEQRGVKVTEKKAAESHDYVNLIRVTANTAGEPVRIGATLIGKKNDPRLVSLNGFDIDMAPGKNMVFFVYEDRPGIIGKVGTVMGNENINIASMQVGRRTKGGQALMGVVVDSPLGPELLDQIKTEVGMEDAWSVEL